MFYSEIKDMPSDQFKRYCGVQRETFLEMVEIVTKAKEGNRGVRAKLSIQDQILLLSTYYREYRTLFHIGKEFGVSESTASRTVKRIENMLLLSGSFSLPLRQELEGHNVDIKVVAVDVTEVEIERPKVRQQEYYSGKQKCHTLKAEVMINVETLEIISTNFDKGTKHDFKLFKESRRSINREIQILADKGYKGIALIHPLSKIPHKKPKGGELTEEQKDYNYTLAKERIVVEHCFRRIKIFRIFSGRYRNRRQRFGLRFNLIAGICNYELRLKYAC
jgi:DDE superfamily endonuclease/Helix-turn-helix of DDE superfamily endonuclease